MGNKELLGPLIEEWRLTHQDRLGVLIKLGVFDLITEHASPRKVQADGLSMDMDFKGTPTVTVDINITKEHGTLFSGERVKVTYDGDQLLVEGAELTFSSQIPQDETLFRQQLGDAFRMAFANPKRIIKTNYNPRLLLSCFIKSSHIELARASEFLLK